MISNQILQETINGMKEVTGIDLCILDLSGRIVVTTMEITDALAQHAEEFADSMAESQVIDGFQYFKIFDDQRRRIYTSGYWNERECIYGRKACSDADTESFDCI